jgi:hypothetical protein
MSPWEVNHEFHIVDAGSPDQRTQGCDLGTLSGNPGHATYDMRITIHSMPEE